MFVTCLITVFFQRETWNHTVCLIPPPVGQILEHTPDGHADRSPLREALERAEELCSQVNEGVREKENSDRLEWIQSHVQCEGPIEVNVHVSVLMGANQSFIRGAPN